MNGEQLLKKKGAGWGIHQPDVIYATTGWMKEASESMEYGKNYKGYWNGEHFVKQAGVTLFCAFTSADSAHLTVA